jgi:hypothetical protein
MKEHAAELNLATFASFLVSGEVLRKSPFELQRNLLAHDAYGVDRIHERLHVRVQKVVLPNSIMASRPRNPARVAPTGLRSLSAVALAIRERTCDPRPRAGCGKSARRVRRAGGGIRVRRAGLSHEGETRYTAVHSAKPQRHLSTLPAPENEE